MLPTILTISIGAQQSMLHDARAVHDSAALRFDEYEPCRKPFWILAALTPGPHSGSATIPGGHIDADAGTLVLPSGAQTSIVKEGAWKAITSSSSSAYPTNDQYFWYEPIEEKRFLVPEDYYSPFIQGGIILFRPMQGAISFEHFGATRLIFQDWAANVASAFTTYEADPHLFDPAPNPSVAQLVQLVSQGNQLLAVVALRNLLSLGLAQPDWLRAQLVRVKGPLCAVFGYLTIVIAGPNVSRPFVQETLQVIDTASEPTLRPLVLGAFAAGLLRSHDTATLARAKAVLVKARQRLVAVGVAVDKDAQLAWMFGKMGV